ncbi:MAG: cation:proton antiporter [Planctomycetota bacterium]|jgi:CPA1 family monovalent cation:H+ antiporter
MNDPIVTGLFYVCLFLLAISAIEHYFRKSIVPAICWIMLGGILYGFVNATAELHLPALNVEPDLVFYVFLPVLIFDSARKLRLEDLRSVAVPIGFFASVGVVLTTVLIGVPFAWIAKVPPLDGLLFGAVLSATDPIAVSAIFGKFTFPERLKTVVEGEALRNDGPAVILCALLSGSVLQGDPFSAQKSAIGLGLAVGGAVLIGLVMGAAGGALVRHWRVLHDRFLGALLPLIAIYLTFGVAEHFLHVSGVIAVMTATLTLGHLHIHRRGERGPGDGENIDRFFDRFWEFLGDLANAGLFFLLGAALGAHDFRPYLASVPLLILILLFSRSGTVYLGSGVLRLVGQRLPLPWQHVLNLAGLKGALSVALILLIPGNYQHREVFLCAAFIMILFSLVANSVAMQVYLKRTVLPGERDSGSRGGVS